MRKKFSYYEYETFFETIPARNLEGWSYRIFTDDSDHKFWLRTDVLRESDEFFDTEEEAALGAIGHISRLEDGEG